MTWNDNGGVWPTTPVDTTPVVELSQWKVVEVTPPGNERHFVGYNLTEGEGRVSSRIVAYDKETRTGATRSGRQYRLVGDTGINFDAEYVYAVWRRVNGVDSEKDVSDEY